MLRTPDQFAKDLAATVDPLLSRQIIESYVEMQQRYLAGDWKPTELDGGRLCEAASRIMYQLDSGTVTYSQLPKEIREKLLDEDRVQRVHKLAQKDRQHIAAAISMVYKMRSDRGAVHISPSYTANGMDSMLVVHAAKWILAEILRLAWNKDRDVVAGVIEQLVQLEISLVHDLDGKPLVLVRGISAPEEVLLLLYHSSNNRLTRAELREYAANQKVATVNMAITRLIKDKDVRAMGPTEVAITSKGQKRVLELIVPKWRSKL
jgi:hypothetical protein